MAASAQHDVFAANRAYGRIDLSVASDSGITRVSRLREEGSYRVRFPAHAGHAEAVLINTAGGIAGGDRFATDIRGGAQTHLVVTTAAAEKVYRALGPAATVDIRLELESGATLAWLPQETILFDRARLARTITVDAADDARLVIAEAIVFGRGAMGETVAAGRLTDHWRVRRGGKLMYADGVRLEGDIAGILRARASADGATAMATVLLLPGNDEIVTAVRAQERAFRGEVGASAWNGLAAVRLIARDGAALRHDLTAVFAALRWPRPGLWMN